jgi:tRNA pseudouridine32 synthase/23S rRNA pseudouridine746 synthase
MLRLLLHDRGLAVGVKPPGLLSVAGTFAPQRSTAATQLFHHLQAYPSAPPSAAAVFRSAPAPPLGFPPTPDHLVAHRLDEGTSGLLLYPLSPAASVGLSRALRARAAEKTYEAVVDTRALPPGSPLARGERAGAVALPLRRRAGVALLHEAAPEGKPSATAWWLLEAGNGCARLELRPATGRTHQLRIHCAEGLGAPIVGDNLYGADDLCAAPFHRELRARGGGLGGAAPEALAALQARAAAALARVAAAGWAGRRPELASCAPLRRGAPPPRLLLHARALALEDGLEAAPGGGAARGRGEPPPAAPGEGAAWRLLCASWSPLATGAGEGAAAAAAAAGPELRLLDLTRTVEWAPPSALGATFTVHEALGARGERWLSLFSATPF